MEAKRIYHVRLYEPFEGKTDYYFGSIKAIYATLTAEIVGVKYNSLTAKKLVRYEGKKCVINVDEIRRNVRHAKD